MSSRPDFATVLFARGQLHPARLVEAWAIQERCGASLESILVRKGDATWEAIAHAWAEAADRPFVDLETLEIQSSILELIPESVARECCVLPISQEGRAITVALADLNDPTLLEKLTFILDRDIRFVFAARPQLLEHIDRYYGRSETESVDSMLVEFTDTAIDFTLTESRPASSIDLEIGASRRDLAPPAGAPLRVGARALIVERQATVRYFHRMTPERMFPLLVVLSKKEVQEVVRKGVSQARSETFQVAEGSLVEIEPILPGCACYPPRELVRVQGGEVTTTFWVVPHVVGQVMQARVVLRQDGSALTEVPLEIRVSRQSATIAAGVASLVLPFGQMLLEHFRLDFKSQLQDGFGLYARVAGWVVGLLSPELLTGVLLAGTLGLYLWLRPRQREVFWDVTFAPEGAESPPAPAESIREWLALADQEYAAGHPGPALEAYDQAFELGMADPIHYFRASLAAAATQNTKRAYAILQEAVQALGAGQIKGPMWFNLGCFAARLGQFPEAVRYLNRAVDSGYDDPIRYRNDPDLWALRWHAGFRRMLQGIGG